MAIESRLVVVDASVVIKWELDDEEYVLEARALRDIYYARKTVRAISPQLMVYEVVNAIAVAARQNRVTPEKASEVMDNLMAFGIEIREVHAARILELALKHRLAAYDAAYLALAEDEDCDLWTGDRVFYQAANTESRRIKWIGDYKR